MSANRRRLLAGCVALLAVGSAVGQTHGVVPRYTLPPPLLARAQAYTVRHTTLQVCFMVWQLLQLWGLLALGVAARLRSVVQRVGRGQSLQACLYTSLLVVLLAVLNLPVQACGHRLAVEYGLSVQGWPSWLQDHARSTAVMAVVGSVLVLVVQALLQRMPRRWWLGFWGFAVVLMVLGVFAAPLVIDPLFNRFEPLASSSPALVQQLQQLAAHAGVTIPADHMVLMRASAKYTEQNAYVTGFGASRRVVVWDTAVQHSSPDELLFVLGHELGHDVLHHILRGMAFAAVLMLELLWLAHRMWRWLLRRYGPRWQLRGPRDLAALPALYLVVLLLQFVTLPVTNAFSRELEHESDVYGQEAIHGLVADPQAIASRSFAEMGAESLEEPDPGALLVWWSFDHPAVRDRVAFAARYNPWSGPVQPRYFKRPPIGLE
ncbi:MAG: M48 family metalloprotease [Acidobacteriota bacterium]|nr:M48 family metalloprotease [Acidobacteriota bacterium]